MRFSIRWNVLWVLGLVLITLTASAMAQSVVSDEKDRRLIDLTVYNHDLALVREVRLVELPKGAFEF